jgi:IS4 transposase
MIFCLSYCIAPPKLNTYALYPNRSKLRGITLNIIKHYKKKTGCGELILEEFRLVAIYNLEDEKYHVYITNISDELLTAKDIAYLYKGRWEIELIFKELKSKYQLDVVETTNVQVILK